MGVPDKMDSCGYFGGGPPPTGTSNYLSPGCADLDKSHITFYHGGRPCYFGHNHRTEAPSTTKAPNPSRVHSTVPWYCLKGAVSLSSLGLVVPQRADLIHYHHTLCGDFGLQIETTMVRTISLPSLNRRDESTPRQRGGVLATARSILMSGRGGHGRPSSSSIRQPTTVDSNASNPLLPERRLQHDSEHQRIAALESLRRELESSRLRAADTVNSI
jgi:hypothetical protein